ncbi:MAG: radical SAM protein [Planctomycetota bacterium]|nr:MAG: radical SAM protein [Planctomycetota bacterium]
MNATKTAARPRETFPVFLIKPSHYDDDGYVIQWARSEVPSNTMAALNGILLDCIERRVLGEHVDVEITAIDETNTRVRPQRIIQRIQAAGGRGLVAFVGVQSNQFPRAMDLARPLRRAGVPVCIGGFHASGSLAMLPEPTAEIREAWELGISIFAGEAEGRLDEVLRDAYRNELPKLYDYLKDLPGLEQAPIPILPHSSLRRNMNTRTSFDCGRGCPFQCSFCTIINVQGRKSRYRSADDIEAILRANHAQGVRSFFITDDNFARNKNWEAIFDRMIELREREGMKSKLIIQVDTLCHLIPNFVEKAGRAGVKRVFIGLENINPDNLAAAKKGQNRITEYRAMLQAWRRIGVITYCGYIIGFPGDTRERVLADLEILKRELPIDLLEFFFLTPLPGSEDHQVLFEKGVWMDPDLNIYDLEHACTGHPLMSPDEFRATYRSAWESFYSPEHLETILRRHEANGRPARKLARKAFYFYACQAVEGIHPLQGGIFRRKVRTDRRPGLPVRNPLVFYPAYLWDIVKRHVHLAALAWRFWRICARVERDPNRRSYTDQALSPAGDEDLEVFEMFTHNASAKDAVEKARTRARAKEQRRAARQTSS